ncbi:MAG TPA: DUF29 family protein [Pirellulales bacterium]|nr:DUF29 family protein [Pirellulales bacterium]
MSHLLKSEYQADLRSGSWQATILEQQRELQYVLERGALRSHAAAVLDDA